MTAQSDIYSLGIVFYEMLTGVVPFDGNNAVSVARKQVEEQAPPLKAYWPDAPDELQKIIDKALAKDIKDRYATAEEMKNDLMEVKNRLYPSKNNDIMLGQTIPLKAIVSNAAVKGAVAANATAQAKAKEERDKYATMVMNPDFLTKKIDGRTTEPDNYGTPENTKRVEPVSTERTEKAAAAAGIAAAGSVIAAANSAAGRRQTVRQEPSNSLCLRRNLSFPGTGRRKQNGISLRKFEMERLAEMRNCRRLQVLTIRRRFPRRK